MAAEAPHRRAPARARVLPPYPLVPAPKTTTPGERSEEDIEGSLCPRAEDKQISRRTRWTVLRLESEGPTEGVYDALWQALGKEGKRWLSVAQHKGVLRALLYKGDDGEINLTTLPASATPYDVRGVTVGGPASRRATIDFARAWLGGAQEATSNFAVESEEEQQAAALEAFEDSQGLSDKDFYLSLAAAKLNGDSRRAEVLKKISPELKSLRSLEKKQQKVLAGRTQDPCYRAVQPAGLHMPTDFVDVESWLGKTWSPESGSQTMTFLHWLNSPEHLERTAVLCSDAGSGKTAVLQGTARTLAIRYQEERPYYLSCGTVNGLRSAHGKGLLKQGVPRVIEDYAPRGNPNGNRQPLEEYLVNLLNVKDGGTIDTPGGCQMALPAAAPQLISTNREFDAWIEKFKGFPMELQHAVSKRVVFFRLPDTPLVRSEQRKRRQEDMVAMVAAGLEREKKLLRAGGREEASTAAAPSEAGSAGATPSSDTGQIDEDFCETCQGPCKYASPETGSVESDGVCWACEEPSDSLVQQLRPACSVPSLGAAERRPVCEKTEASPTASTTTGGGSSPTGSGCKEFRPEGGVAAPHAAPAVFTGIAAGHNNFGDLDDGSADAEGRDLE